MDSPAAMVKMALAMAIFGSVGFFSNQTNLPAFELVFVRCICATLFLSMCWLFSGQYKREHWQKREVLRILACGVFLVFNWVFLFKAFQYTSVTIAISVYHLAPVLVLLLGSFFYRERLTMAAVLAVAACLVGTVLVSGLQGTNLTAALTSKGMLWGVGAALLYAGTTLLGKGIVHTSAYAITFIQTLLGIFLLLPFQDFHAFLPLTATNWLYVLATGLLHTGFVYYLFFDSLRQLSSRWIAILVFVDPAVAILLDTLFTGFIPTLLQTVGIVLIFGGMAVGSWRGKQTRRVTE
ncbi:permease, drug/metabolite transporter superfamily protein [Fictibacillus macauensis ZFHKF-1]|uniref:Permease, drug/metabolite transporter superfamily protein n=1 Tax=Fictibacillus macauensis ZFHKF-1 TaxID=1196324 RepID=I8AG45_9BACL|nr:DMT family transporter [Fictibacillus macauensis]EIT84364.1 permease, drug/metabolite transporter superfamily protein [Fictibacillus macauensis ZFHKF-1]